MRTVTVSHNWYSFPRCSGIAVPTVFGVPSDVSCQDRGRVCRAWSGLVGMEAELGHSLTDICIPKEAKEMIAVHTDISFKDMSYKSNTVTQCSHPILIKIYIGVEQSHGQVHQTEIHASHSISSLA